MFIGIIEKTKSIFNAFIENISEFFNVFYLLNTQAYVLAIIEILIIAFFIYKLLMWVKDNRVFSLLKGLIIIFVFYLLALTFDFDVIVKILNDLAPVAAISAVIIFQEDIRAGLEHLGRQNVLSKFIPDLNKFTKKISDETLQEISEAAFSMGRVKTGALMVIEHKESLEGIEKTGIPINGKVSRQLLINIFEKNTPLHDGAVLIVGDIIKAATCYLPISRNTKISKDLGTRHRAALGVSEMSDSLTVVVSEETGNVSLCYRGELTLFNDVKELKTVLSSMLHEDENTNKKNKFDKIKDWFKRA